MKRVQAASSPIYLMFHGETGDDIREIWRRPEIGLNAAGFAQARRASDTARGLSLGLIATAPEAPGYAAWQAASVVGSNIGYPLGGIAKLRELDERNFGPLPGTDKSDFVGDAESYAKLEEIEGVEPAARVCMRAAAALSRIREFGKPALVVAHESMGRALYTMAQAHPPGLLYDLEVPGDGRPDQIIQIV